MIDMPARLGKLDRPGKPRIATRVPGRREAGTDLCSLVWLYSAAPIGQAAYHGNIPGIPYPSPMQSRSDRGAGSADGDVSST